MQNGIAVQAENLSKRYGDLAAVGVIDLEIAVGKVFGSLGPNGAGKTKPGKRHFYPAYRRQADVPA